MNVPECQCEAAGWCAVMKRQMHARDVATCRRENLTPAKCDFYRQHWYAQAHPEVVPPAIARARNRQEDPQLVGNRFQRLARWLGLEHCRGCDARRRALNYIDRWVRNRLARVTASGRLAVVTTLFNPLGYPVFWDNYHVWRDTLGRAPLYTGELCFPGQQPVGDGPLKLQGDERHVLFQKERLINLVVAQLPARFDRIAWIDADFVSGDPDWYAKLEKLLDEYPVVQMAEHFVINGKKRPSCVATGGKGFCAWGGAWAARREVFPLYDGGIIGGGDWACACAWMQLGERFSTPSPGWKQHYRTWAGRAWQKVRRRVGLLKQEMFHLDHGSNQGRQYNSRVRLVAGMNPYVDLETDEQGLWRWRSEKYAANLKLYFERRQDG